MSESETVAAFRRAGKRAAFHLLRAAVESLRAFEVLVDELAKVGHSSEGEIDPSSPTRERIDVE
jgi:hypothetical protein